LFSLRSTQINTASEIGSLSYHVAHCRCSLFVVNRSSFVVRRSLPRRRLPPPCSSSSSLSSSSSSLLSSSSSSLLSSSSSSLLSSSSLSLLPLSFFVVAVVVLCCCCCCWVDCFSPSDSPQLFCFVSCLRLRQAAHVDHCFVFPACGRDRRLLDTPLTGLHCFVCLSCCAAQKVDCFLFCFLPLNRPHRLIVHFPGLRRHVDCCFVFFCLRLRAQVIFFARLLADCFFVARGDPPPDSQVDCFFLLAAATGHTG